ncbi:hypothetical protein GBF35_01215 [Nonomuraea phyllanthi]|uniref:hypothetical protein n=1 Tax=Nonomuraea phyllanthi TaxID=2219224 RepID=UPI001293D1F8|nr:hypothetical protein [Nonomuraea phyllanthi]QFY05478.1 hypothetical protein GBF35_01215 [Nonomuraea phyllanthi]
MTRIDPRTIAFTPPGAGLAMAALTGLRIRIPKGDNLPVLYVVDPKEPGRWAAVVTRSDEPVVYEFGDRRLWEAYFGGCPGGQPNRDRRRAADLDGLSGSVPTLRLRLQVLRRQHHMIDMQEMRPAVVRIIRGAPLSSSASVS